MQVRHAAHMRICHATHTHTLAHCHPHTHTHTALTHPYLNVASHTLLQLNVAGFSLVDGLWVPEEEGEDDRAFKGGEMAQVSLHLKL